MLSLVIFEWIIFFPSLKCIHPLGQIWFLKFTGFDQFTHSFECIFDITSNGEMCVHIFIVLRFIDIEVDDIGFLGIFFYLARNPIIKAGTCTQKQIAFTNRPISRNRPMHTVPVERLFMVGVKNAKSHKGVRNW